MEHFWVRNLLYSTPHILSSYRAKKRSLEVPQGKFPQNGEHLYEEINQLQESREGKRSGQIYLMVLWSWDSISSEISFITLHGLV